MKHIGIIGGGFSGMMTATQIIHQTNKPINITIIESNKEQMAKGIAYTPYSHKHILNVITSRMSAFPDEPDHFLNWVMQQPYFQTKDRTLIANSFLSRKLYGDYLEQIWNETQQKAAQKNGIIDILHHEVAEINCQEGKPFLTLTNGNTMSVDECVIASGNILPRNPRIGNLSFFQSKHYFQNPWAKASVENLDDSNPILIIGNGLTMVDTILGCLEQGYKGKFISISPNGFNILMHRHNGMQYQQLTKELPATHTLKDLVKLVNKHIKTVREFGVSAEPVIDSLRPHTHRIWQQLTDAEKLQFFSRLRHLWGVARHRIPVHSFDKIQQLRVEGRLNIIAGKLVDIKEEHQTVEVHYYDKKQKDLFTIQVSRVINCTGPETDLSQVQGHFLQHCLFKNLLVQDVLKLGIRANTNNYRIQKPSGGEHPHLYTLGGFLKGELWESTAVGELRIQAKQLAKIILENV